MEGRAKGHSLAKTLEKMFSHNQKEDFIGEYRADIYEIYMKLAEH